MAGRRVAQKSRGHNPLYSLFMFLLALSAVLLVAVLILSAKLRAANKQLAQYRAPQTEQTEQTEPAVESEEALIEPAPVTEQKKNELPTIDKGVVDRSETAAPTQSENKDQEQSAAPAEKKVGWLDLTGHNEVEVVPSGVFDQYRLRYAVNGVNLRGGPGTEYGRVKLLELGTEVAAVAEQGDWTFVGVDGKFGWIKTEYLADERPEAPKAEEEERAEESNAELPIDSNEAQPTE